MEKNLNWDIDRQAKCDFTASTVEYNRTISGDGYFEFYEMDDDGRLVPFGSSAASLEARVDVWFKYSTPKGHRYGANELKERHNLSDAFPTAYLNLQKLDELDRIRKKDNSIFWSELYTDGVIRIWNLTKVDFEALPLVKVYIKKITIDPDSEVEEQWRRTIPMSSGITITRIRG